MRAHSAIRDVRNVPREQPSGVGHALLHPPRAFRVRVSEPDPTFLVYRLELRHRRVHHVILHEIGGGGDTQREGDTGLSQRERERF